MQQLKEQKKLVRTNYSAALFTGGASGSACLTSPVKVNTLVSAVFLSALAASPSTPTTTRFPAVN